MTIESRIKQYKSFFGADCKALEVVRGFILPVDRLEALEAIRGLNTELSNLYMVSLPTITVWVRDTNYVAQILVSPSPLSSISPSSSTSW